MNINVIRGLTLLSQDLQMNCNEGERERDRARERDGERWIEMELEGRWSKKERDRWC